MKPHELADITISKIEFNSNDSYQLTISWNNGKLEYCHLFKVKFNTGQWFDCKTIKDIETKYGGLHKPHMSSMSHGSLTTSYYIKPCSNRIKLNSEVIAGIYDCIKYYEWQLEGELKESKDSLKLIKEQY